MCRSAMARPCTESPTMFAPVAGGVSAMIKMTGVLPVLSLQPVAAAAAMAALLSLLYVLLWSKKRPYPLPPGPPGRFLVGNLGQLSPDRPEQDYIRWGREYGRCASARDATETVG